MKVWTTGEETSFRKKNRLPLESQGFVRSQYSWSALSQESSLLTLLRLSYYLQRDWKRSQALLGHTMVGNRYLSSRSVELCPAASCLILRSTLTFLSSTGNSYSYLVQFMLASGFTQECDCLYPSSQTLRRTARKTPWILELRDSSSEGDYC